MRVRAVALILLAAGTASGGIEHTILHGVSVSRIRAWVGPEAIPGLSTERLRGLAESRLKEAGIPLSNRGDAVLTITARVYGTDSVSCFVTLEGNLVEPAKLERNGMSVAATSWHRGGTVITAMPDCAESTIKAADRALADFVEVYRAMNPGPATGR